MAHKNLDPGVLERWSIGVLKFKRFEFRVQARDEPIGRELTAERLGRIGYELK